MSTIERRVYTLSAFLVLACLLLMTQESWGNVRWWAVPLMVVVVFVSESCNIKLQIGKHHWLVAFTESSISAALLFAPGSWLVPAISLGVLVSLLRTGRNRLKMMFNTVQFAVSAAVGVWAAALAGGGVFGASVGIGAFWLVNYLAVVLIVRLTSEAAAASRTSSTCRRSSTWSTVLPTPASACWPPGSRSTRRSACSRSSSPVR